jgi:hypothetical protein
MTKFWCPWCGETAESGSRDDRVPCIRCLREFTLLFGFIPTTWMDPLEPGEEPGEPAAARKSFTFYDPATGHVLGRTQQPVLEPRERAC